ncbi:MAG TPA: thioredoxin family protein [Candidatus Bathyarchaeia archaeon]|jgi:thioredoxin 1|nr:thioredoxin family protein [Candidatus Bathyarchaeia archaeon]
MSGIIEISADSFHKEVVDTNGLVVVEFFSHSCPHCIRFKPIYEELSEIFSTQAKFVKIDVLLSEDNRDLAHGRGVKSVPSIEVFSEGRVIGGLVGCHHLEKVYKAIKGFLTEKEENIGPSTPLESLRTLK